VPEMNGKVLNWASDLDPNALTQAQRAAEMPFVPGHVALMPDARVGMGTTIELEADRPLRAEVAELRSRIDAGLLTADEARRLEDRD
jgi:hypothetical protein